LTAAKQPTTAHIYTTLMFKLFIVLLSVW